MRQACAKYENYLSHSDGLEPSALDSIPHGLSGGLQITGSHANGYKIFRLYVRLIHLLILASQSCVMSRRLNNGAWDP
jgi:hypothetical protein